MCGIALIFLSVLFFGIVDSKNVKPSASFQPFGDFKQKIVKPKFKGSTIDPIVFLPGFGGSGLDMQLDGTKEPHVWCWRNQNWRRVWIDLLELLPYVSLDCFYHNFKVHYSVSQNLWINPPGVNIRGTDYGNCSGVAYMSDQFPSKTMYMNDFIDYFVDNHGYERGVSFRAATYDWRVGPQNYVLPGGEYDKLKSLVEDTYVINGNKKVVLMSHSMGGPFANYFLSHLVSKEWKEKYVKAFIPVGGSFDGSFVGILLALLGSTWDLPNVKLDKIRHLEHEFGALQWMIPSKLLLNDTAIVTPKRNYTAGEYPSMLSDAGYDVMRMIFESVQNFSIHDAPHVPIYCVYGVNVQTPKTHFVPDLLQTNYSGVEVLEFSDGDSIVHIESLMECDEFRKKQDEQVTVHRLDGLGHSSMFHEELLYHTIEKIVVHP